MLPCVSPCAVAQGIADSVVGNGRAVVGGQQVAPLGIAIGIGYHSGGRAQLPGDIGVLAPGKDVACVVICPGVGKAARLIVLPDELPPQGALEGIAIHKWIVG